MILEFNCHSFFIIIITNVNAVFHREELNKRKFQIMNIILKRFPLVYQDIAVMRRDHFYSM